MMKKNVLTTMVVAVLYLGSSCVKNVKDAIDESDDAIECANTLQRITNDDGTRPCTEQIADIDAILRTCDEFLSEEEKENLTFARNNCQDN